MTDREYLEDAAKQVDLDITNHPDAGIEVDPDVAEFMGATPEDALSLEDALDSVSQEQLDLER